MTISMTIGGRLIDVDGDTKLGLSWDSGLFSDGGLKVSRSFGLSVPCSPANDKTFEMSFSQDYPGLRQSAQCTIVAGGIALNGRVFLQETDGRRYDLLFVYGDLYGAVSGIFADNIGSYLVDLPDRTVLTGSKADLVMGGFIPGFSWYAYHNGAVDPGTAVTPNGLAGMFPSANLGYLIFAAAQAAGYTVNFPATPYQNAYKFGLVLPTMNTFTEEVCRIRGSARNGYTDMVGNLAAAGLTMATRRYKRGRYNANVTCYVLVATKAVNIKYIASDAATNTKNVFAKGQGYGFPQTWIDDFQLDYSVADFHLNAGEWFAVVSWDDMVVHDGLFNLHKYWRLADGYETAIDCTFTVQDDSGTVNVGETLYLSDNLPDMSLAELCNAYCGMCDLLMTVNEPTKEITFTPLSAVIAGSVVLDLDSLMRSDVEGITRYIDGFARHNRVRCQSAGYVSDGCRFVRDYPCDNDSLEQERDMVVVPFNEGNWEIGAGGKEAVFEDVEYSAANASVSYKGVLSVFYEAPVGGYALHVQTINDAGVGVEASEATLNAMQCRVTARIPLAKFARLKAGDIARLHGLLWTVKAATWSGDVAELELIYLKS